MQHKHPDIKPRTSVSTFDRTKDLGEGDCYPLNWVAPIVGMSKTFIRRVVGQKSRLSDQDLINLLDQDAHSETFIPRSKVIEYLRSFSSSDSNRSKTLGLEPYTLIKGDALQQLRSFRSQSISCVVTSTPYWALRIYQDAVSTQWADGAFCVYGHEQTPEEFLRHTSEILHEIYRVLDRNGSVWWNIMDSFNTRTQIRYNASESLKAMQGKDPRKWREFECRRYSAGHSYLKDGEQCLIPSRIAERASRMGYYVKSVITWAKTATLPEPQNSRVSRNIEYVLHLSKVRSPTFDKTSYLKLNADLGGRNPDWETEKLSDVWVLPTSSGRDGHGAQFPISLPGRCISLSTAENDLVLDPFVGAGNAGVAALKLQRRFVGIDVSKTYLTTANQRLRNVLTDSSSDKVRA